MTTTEASAEQAPGRVQGATCALTVIVEADPRNPDLLASIRAIRDGVALVEAQVIVTCEELWFDVPDGVEVVVFPSPGLGDRYDAASRSARGQLLAFVDSQVTFDANWAPEVLRAFEDPNVVIAGGPVVPQGQRRSERVSAFIMTHYLGGTPAAHNSRAGSLKSVREVGSSNLIVRTSAFRAVGGFQTPPSEGGEAVRLCYKVRTLLGGRISSEPGLALGVPAPRFGRFVRNDIAIYGRSRGHLARRLPEAAPLFPYALPSVVSVLLSVLAVLFVVTRRADVGTALAITVGVLMLAFASRTVRSLRGPGSLGDRVVAGLALPAVVLMFGVTFLRGYTGRSREDISPPKDRESPLRVLIMNWRDVTHPWSGGAETYMHQIARRWASEGMDVAWLSQRHPGSKFVEIIDRIRVYRVGGRLTLYPRAALTYLTRLRGRYDIIVDCENGIPFFSPLYSRVPRVLVVHHVHQEIFREQLPKQLRWLALWLEGSFMPRLYRHAPVVAVSEGTRADLAALGFDPQRIKVVTNGVIPPKTAERSPAPHATILCMGRLKPQKSVDVLIRSMPMILEQIPDLHVDVVGQGPDRKRLERLAWSTGMAGHIRFHGYVRAKVRDEIAATAWIAVCPSAFEGWGVVCMEASARGLPVVASDVAGLRESVRDGETGMLFPYGDDRALAGAVISLLKDPERREEMGAAGKRWAARHTWDDSASTFASLLGSHARVQPVGPESYAPIDLTEIDQIDVTGEDVGALPTWR